MTSEMGEAFNEWKKHKQAKRASNLEWSTNKLTQEGIEFKSLNGGVHLKIGDIDFWPSTGLIMRKGYELGRGVNKLIKLARKGDNS